MHNVRIGRFFAIDPLAAKYPHNSPYAFSENRVVDGRELEGLEVGIVIGVEARATAILSVSDATDIIIYFDGIFNDDTPSLKIIAAHTSGSGYGTIGANIGWHVGIWIGDDENISGEGLTFGLDVHVIGGASLGIGLAKDGNTIYGWESLPKGMMVTVGQGWGLSADLYGESTETETEVLFQVDINGNMSGSIVDFFTKATNNSKKQVQKGLKSQGINLSNKQMNKIQHTIKKTHQEMKKNNREIKKMEKKEQKKREKHWDKKRYKF